MLSFLPFMGNISFNYIPVNSLDTFSHSIQWESLWIYSNSTSQWLLPTLFSDCRAIQLEPTIHRTQGWEFVCLANYSQWTIWDELCSSHLLLQTVWARTNKVTNIFIAHKHSMWPFSPQTALTVTTNTTWAAIIGSQKMQCRLQHAGFAYF